MRYTKYNFFYTPHKHQKSILLPHIAHMHTNTHKVKQESYINYKYFTYGTTFVKNIIFNRMCRGK